MLARITIYLIAISFMLASCAKETFNFANTSTFNKVRKDQQTSPAFLTSSTDNQVSQIIETDVSKTVYASTDKLSAPATKSVPNQALHQKPTSTFLQAPAASKIVSDKITAKQTRRLKYFNIKANNKQIDKKIVLRRNQIIAAILAYFLGGLGVHRFYLGYIDKGLLQLGGSLLGTILAIAGLLPFLFSASVPMSAPLLIGSTILFAVYIWILIDFIRILTGKLKPKNGEYTNNI